MVLRLDDLSLLARLDASKMLEAIREAPDRLRECDSYDIRLRKYRFSNMVLMGMGGSASAADVVTNWLETKIRIPTMVVRQPTLPGFIGPKTVFVAISYSGNTEETLTAFHSARRRGSTIIGIGTGGRLGALCNNYNLPFVTVPETVAPRAALPQLVAALGATLEKLGIASNVVRQIVESGVELKRLTSRLVPESSIRSNSAKRLALKLDQKFVLIYSIERMSSVARRFKNQLAENSKIISKYDSLPEAGHNEVESWRSPDRHVLPFFVRDPLESLSEKKLIGAFQSTIRYASGISPVNLRMSARTSLGRFLGPILFLDYVSVYMAFLRGIDPTPTEMIARYKNR